MELICNVAYSLDFPSNMSSIHLVFYVSMLRMLVNDPCTILPLESVEVEENMTYEKILMEIILIDK